MTPTDKIIEDIYSELIRTSYNQTPADIYDILRKHLSSKVILDRSLIEELIEKGLIDIDILFSTNGENE